jgi:hypothetical protein
MLSLVLLGYNKLYKVRLVKGSYELSEIDGELLELFEDFRADVVQTFHLTLQLVDSEKSWCGLINTKEYFDVGNKLSF